VYIRDTGRGNSREGGGTGCERESLAVLEAVVGRAAADLVEQHLRDPTVLGALGTRSRAKRVNTVGRRVGARGGGGAAAAARGNGAAARAHPNSPHACAPPAANVL
jgi:hypothetical protein